MQNKIQNRFTKYSILKSNENVVRILDTKSDEVFIIDCVRRAMPTWVMKTDLDIYDDCSEEELLAITDIPYMDIESFNTETKKLMFERYTLISPVLPFISNTKKRKELLNTISEMKGISKQTIRHYLCLFLVYQNISVLAPRQEIKNRELTPDEKNMRWALNKFFYTQNKNSLNTAYTLLLKEKYCDSTGTLTSDYPSFYQFRYFYRRTKKMQNFYISRNGLKDYQKNHRPLLGDGIQEYAKNVGMAMFDATICDIYLINESGNLVGRPILTTCIDGYSSLCMGYSLSWEGGMYSLRNLMLNVITNKKEHCKQFGITIDEKDWDSSLLPSTLITDMGTEYTSENFEQMTDLGITVVNLPAYRPELKGNVEKFFDLVQDTFKQHLKGKGVIEPDWQQRGSHDYRKDACLTMTEFEKIILHCILYYNSQRIVDNFPYTQDMVEHNIQPFASDIWEWGKQQVGANLIETSKEELILTLLPRTIGKFTRQGLRVNKLRYKHPNYVEKYLNGGEVTVAYNPDDVSFVWLIENGFYIRFELIESRYKGKELDNVSDLQSQQKSIVKAVKPNNIQAQINLAQSIEAIVSTAHSSSDTNIKSIRNTRNKEQNKTHKDFMKEGMI